MAPSPSLRLVFLFQQEKAAAILDGLIRNASHSSSCEFRSLMRIGG